MSKGNPLLALLRPVAQVMEYPTPAREGLNRWIRDRAAEKGAPITPGAIRILSQHVGGNLWTMDNELEKLALYVGDRTVEEGDVRLLVTVSREANIFSAVDAVLEGRSAAALQLIQRLRNEGAELPYIVTMVARQLRMATLAKELMGKGHGEKEIGDRLHLSHEFALKRTMTQARKHSWTNLKLLYVRLLEADLAVKQGRMDQNVALDLLVGESSGPASVSATSARRS